jgi:hypothetical protein
VALSADGSTALIGGPESDVGPSSSNGGEVGAAWAFRRLGTNWATEGSALTGNGEKGDGDFGWSVALSAEGDTALIGGAYDNTPARGQYGVGAAWVFRR